MRGSWPIQKFFLCPKAIKSKQMPMSVSQSVPLSELGQRGAFASPPPLIACFFNFFGVNPMIYSYSTFDLYQVSTTNLI